MNHTRIADNIDKDIPHALLAGKSILVTGGGSGLGAALCRTLAAAGASIMVGDRNRQAAESVAESLYSGPAVVHAMHFDVGDPVAAERAILQTVETLGSLDVLINNAGTDVTCPLDELSHAE